MAPTRTVLAAGRLRAWGDGGGYLKLMFLVQSPHGLSVLHQDGARAWRHELEGTAVCTKTDVFGTRARRVQLPHQDGAGACDRPQLEVLLMKRNVQASNVERSEPEAARRYRSGTRQR